MSCCATLSTRPRPASAPTSSAATSVVQDACSDSRRPVKIIGIAPGTRTSQICLKPRAPSTREASRTCGSIDRTPACELMTDGTKAAKKITMIFAPSPSPSQRIASGIQASGGIGRMREKTGVMKASKRPLAPMRIPSGAPSATATRKPMRTKRRLRSACCHRLASAYPAPPIWRAASQTCGGEGNRPAVMKEENEVENVQNPTSMSAVQVPTRMRRRPRLTPLQPRNLTAQKRAGGGGPVNFAQEESLTSWLDPTQNGAAGWATEPQSDRKPPYSPLHFDQPLPNRILAETAC